MALGVSSCDDKYGDDLRDLGRRVEILEDSLPKMNRTIEAIHTIIYTIESDGYITDVQKNNDGTYTLKFNNGKEVTLHDGEQGRSGNDGRAQELDISVAKGDDGVWYWTLNGKWIFDDDGNRMRAGALDGKNGKDGADGLNGKNGNDDINMTLPIPLIRINPVTRYWEISEDGGSTYKTTGVLADGNPGKDGTVGNFELNAAKGEDGILYWTYNGQWLLDENGNRMPAQGSDGKDGVDGKDGKDDVDMELIVPKVRINPDTRMWEISTDNGETYKSTGILADGKDGNKGSIGDNGMDGINGKDGTDGRDDIFLDVIISSDGKNATIILRDNRVFRISISGSGDTTIETNSFNTH